MRVWGGGREILDPVELYHKIPNLKTYFNKNIKIYVIVSKWKQRSQETWGSHFALLLLFLFYSYKPFKITETFHEKQCFRNKYSIGNTQ